MPHRKKLEIFARNTRHVRIFSRFWIKPYSRWQAQLALLRLVSLWFRLVYAGLHLFTLLRNIIFTTGSCWFTLIYAGFFLNQWSKASCVCNESIFFGSDWFSLLPARFYIFLKNYKSICE